MSRALIIALIVIGALVLVGVTGFIVVGRLMSRPMSREEAEGYLEGRLASLRMDSRLRGACLALGIPERGLTIELESPEREGKAFHTASVGKLFTAVLVAKKVEEGTISWETPIYTLLEPDTLRGLVSPADEKLVTVAELLAHTSGMADYFAGETSDGAPTVAEAMVQRPDLAWDPAALLAHGSSHQEPGTRGQYRYSDTGYAVLGLAIERLYGQGFVEAVHGHIFDPLGMNDSYYPLRSRPRNREMRPLGDTWLGAAEVSKAASISADWAGGGAASTLADLRLFAAALAEGRIVKRDTLRFMSRVRNRFERGTHYGYGIMTLRFGEFFPLLGRLPDMIGHMGILGTMLFIDPENGVSAVVNLGADGRMEDAVRLVIDAATCAARIR